MDLEPSKVLELRQNFRNKYPIARLAREFHTRDPATPPPDLPERPSAQHRISTPILYPYDPQRLSAIARRILNRYETNTRHLVGVIAPNNKSRMRFLKAIRAAAEDPSRSTSRPLIETFSATHRPDVRFDTGGILVINVQACKGLEFDVVFCADINDHFFDLADLDTLRKRFYVMVARAREQVILLTENGGGGQVEGVLPVDGTVLSWR